MARKKKHPEHVNNERWLVSYADFITLLFAFFVVMFSVSQVDSKRVGRFTQSFAEALEWSGVQTGGGGLLANGRSGSKQKAAASQGPNATPVSVGEAQGATPLQQLREALEKETIQIPELKGLSVFELRGEIVLRLPERLMFDVGEARVHEDGRKALATISAVLATRNVRIRIEGHTDSKPINTARFPSNWDLSTARAVAVVAWFLELKQIEPAMLSAAGYAEHHPIADNATAEGRALNRRVDIILVTGLVEEEVEEPTP